MKISVIVTCFKEGEQLATAVSSLHRQTFKDYELLIVNDHSTDPATNEVCDRLEQSGIKIIRRTVNGGLSAARNTGIAAAKHEIIVPLDADDILPVDALQIIHNAFSVHECDFISGNYLASGQLVDTSILCSEAGQLNPGLLARNWILLGTSPFKKQLWNDINGYDEHPLITNSVQDIDFFMNAILAEKTGVHIPAVIYQWNDTPGSMNKHISAECFCHLNIKNIRFLEKYKFKSVSQMNNYMVTMLFQHRQYQLLRNFAASLRFSSLSFKNKIKYLYTFFLKGQYE